MPLSCNDIQVTVDYLLSQFSSCKNLKAEDLRLLVELVNTVNNCSGGNIQQDNIIVNTDLGLLTTDTVTNLINNLPLFTISETQIYLFTVTDDTGTIDRILQYVLVSNGKGDYGVGGTQLTDSDLILLNPIQEEVVRNTTVIDNLIQNNTIFSGVVDIIGPLELTSTQFDYAIGGDLYKAPAISSIPITPPIAEDRIDVIALNTDSELIVIEGQESMNPLEPTLTDFENQIRVTSLRASFATQSVENFSTELIYDENTGEPGEWTVTENTGGLRIDTASFTNPYSGGISIQCVGVGNTDDTITFTNDTVFDTNLIDTFTFRIFLTAIAISRRGRIIVDLKNGGTTVGRVTIRDNRYGYSRTVTGQYQNIIIPKADFDLIDNNVDSIDITFTNLTFPDLNIDNVRFNTGVVTPPNNDIIGINLINATNDNGLGANTQVGSNIRDFYVFEDELVFQQGGLDGQYVLQLSDTFKNSINIPTNTSSFINDGSDNTSTYVELDELSTVATTGSYNDLLNLPIIPTNTSDLVNDGEDTINSFITLADIVIPSLQQVTDIGNSTTNNIDVLSVNGLSLFAQTGVDADNIGIGINALSSNTGTNSIAIGSNSLANNTGAQIIAIGIDALENNTGQQVVAIGHFAGQSNIGTNGLYIGYQSAQNYSGSAGSVSIGTQAMKNNTSTSFGSVAIGNNSLDNVSGSLNTAIGNFTGTNIGASFGNVIIGESAAVTASQIGSSNVFVGESAASNLNSTTGSNVLIGRRSGRFLNGNENIAIGFESLEESISSTSIAIGDRSGQFLNGNQNIYIGNNSGMLSADSFDNISIGYRSSEFNSGNQNTVIGSLANSIFNDDITNSKDVNDASTDIDTGLNRITIANHGFGSNGDYISLRYNSTGANIGGINNNQIYVFEIIDVNTIEYVQGNISSTGTDTHTFTPQFVYDNVTVLGANAEPTKSNQVTLGDTFTEEVLTSGTVVTGGYTVATLPTGVTGARAYVTDATTTTFYSIVAGGGSNVVPVFYNGTNWIIA